jgi:mRNA interferase MazF
VWDVDFDDFGMHPAVVFSINPLNTRLGHVAVSPIRAAITFPSAPSTPREISSRSASVNILRCWPTWCSSSARSPTGLHQDQLLRPVVIKQTHVPLTADAGLTRYDESYADITALQPVARSQLLTRRGLLTRTEMERLGRQIATYLSL